LDREIRTRAASSPQRHEAGVGRRDGRVAMGKPKFVYVTYIRTTPEKLWAALTDPQTIGKYWFGMNAESDFKAGSSWRLKFEDGRTADTGEILEAVPRERLVIRWRNEFKPELKAEGWSRCTMQIEMA